MSTTRHGMTNVELVEEADGSVYLTCNVGTAYAGVLKGGPRRPHPSPRSYAEIYILVVHPDHRQQGVGAALVERFTRWAISKGYEWVSVECSPRNDVALRFYRRQGFTARSVLLDIDLPEMESSAQREA